MALQISYTSTMGFVAPSAYVRISHYAGDKDGVRAIIDIYYDVTSRTSGQSPIGRDILLLPIADGATMASMYTAMKEFAMYASATDV
jgi:hypothetical protein